MTRKGQITASVMVRNTGKAKGTETVQMYIQDIAASVVRPVKELKSFLKVTLEPGKEQKVSFAITDREIRFLSENGIWESELGEFEVFIGGSSATENAAGFSLTLLYTVYLIFI